MLNRLRRIPRWTWIVSAIILVAYVALFLRYNIGKTTMSRDVAWGWTLAASNVPVGDRAWPILKDLEPPVELEPTSDHPFAQAWPNVSPHDDSWPQLVEFVNQRASAIDRVLTASEKRALAFYADKMYTTKPLTEFPKNGKVDSALLINVPLPPFGVMRRASRLLQVHARVSLSNGNVADALREVDAVIALAKMCRETNDRTGELVYLALLANARNIVLHMLESYPGALKDEQLQSLSHTMRALPNPNLDPGTTTENEYVEDWLQRMYTDDGKGNGRLIFNVDSSVGPRPTYNRFIGPVTSIFEPSRAELRSAWQRYCKALNNDHRTPAWELQELSSTAVFDSIPDHGQYKFIKVFMNRDDRTRSVLAMLDIDRGGILAAIALERWRLSHKRYPDSIEQLVPKYLEELPIDACSGKPLVYRLVDGKPILYSVGNDGNDDLGKVDDPSKRTSKQRENTPPVYGWCPAAKRANAPDADHVLFDPAGITKTRSGAQ